MERVSAHDSLNEMHGKVEEDGMSTLHDRHEAMEEIRCQQCAEGVRCNICSMGPCRIIPGKTERGVCGIDKDGIVMRNLVKTNLMGTSAYSYHARTAAETLKAAADPDSIFEVTDEEKLRSLADRLGLDAEKDTDELAVDLADFALRDLNRTSHQNSRVMEKIAPEKGLEKWEEAGILPGGPMHELVDTQTSVMTNVDADYQSMALKTLRMGLSTSFGALTLLEDIQDILFGTPTPHESEVDMGIIDPEYVNILPNGHEPFVGAALIEVARRDEVQQKARDAGAEGIRIVGSIETGQELMQRFETDDVFAGITGNWLNEEYVMATGAVDALVADMNCTVPTVGEYAEEYGGKVIPVNDLVSIPGEDTRISYDPRKAEEQALQIIDEAIDNFRDREGKETHVPDETQEVVTGFSAESVTEALGGSLDPLVEQIAEGNVKGVVALVSCATLNNGPGDQNTIDVARELIERNFLVLSAGCGNAALQVAGLATPEAAEEAGDGLQTVCESLGVPPVLSFGTCTDAGRLLNIVGTLADELDADPSDLPVAVTAPEYMEQKANIDATAAVAYGLYTHVSPVPPVTGSENVTRLLTEDVEEITGGKMEVSEDPVAAVDGIEAHVEEKRELLGLAKVPEPA